VNPASSEPPVLEISARVIQADGQRSGSATKSGVNTFAGYLWSDAECGVAGGDRDPSRATAGWKFSASSVRQSGNSVDVRIEWQRVWDQQRHVTSGTATVLERTMRLGERVQIDRVDLGAGSRTCASTVLLEASVPLVSSSFGRTDAIRPSSRGAAGGRGIGAGRGAPTPTPMTEPRPMTRGGSAGAGTGRGGRAGMNTGGTMYTAQLWLMHTSGTTDETAPTQTGRGGRASAARPGSEYYWQRQASSGSTYQQIRFPASGAGFSFSPVSIATSRGTSYVVVMGTLSAKLENELPKTLVVTMSRQTLSPDQPSAASGGNSSTKEIPWPPPGEVISFELPPAPQDSQDPLAQQKMSIRLQIGSAAGRGRMR